MAVLLQSWPLRKFKADRGLSTLEVFESKQGNFYVLDEDGEYLASVDPQVQSAPAEEVVVLHLQDENDPSDEWFYITLAGDREPSFVL